MRAFLQNKLLKIHLHKAFILTTLSQNIQNILQIISLVKRYFPTGRDFGGFLDSVGR
jgi:hypothetical protein